MPTFASLKDKVLGKNVKTYVITEDEDGRRAAFVIPHGSGPQFRVESEHEDYQLDFEMPLLSRPTFFSKTLEIPLGEHKQLIGDGPDGMHGEMDAVLGKAMAVIDDHLDHLEHEALHKRRRTAAESLLESQGIKPKRAAKLAAALIETVDGVK